MRFIHPRRAYPRFQYHSRDHEAVHQRLLGWRLVLSDVDVCIKKADETEREMDLSIPDTIRRAAKEPQDGVPLLVGRIRSALPSFDYDTARPLAYALIGLAVENNLADSMHADAVRWLLVDTQTNRAIARRLKRFAIAAGDRVLAQEAAELARSLAE